MQKDIFRIYEEDGKGLVSECMITSISQLFGVLKMIDTLKPKLMKQLAEITGDKEILEMINSFEKVDNLPHSEREQIAKDLIGILKGK